MSRRDVKITAWVNDHSASWQTEALGGNFYADNDMKLSAMSQDELKSFFYLIENMSTSLKKEVRRRLKETKNED